MRNAIIALILIFVLVAAGNAQSQTIVPSVTKINLAWVDGVYTNPQQLPRWGFFIDAQEETMFGAVYGYNGNDSTFITLQGSITSADPLTYDGDVFFLTNGGATVENVGNFTWRVRTIEASPGALLTISSNILNASNLPLTRFSYVEEDKIDILTGADWNITTRILGVNFGNYYGIYDDRVDSDGLTGALIIDNTDTDLIGAAAYLPPGEGDAYGFMIPFTGETDLFTVFFASDTEMYGRYWLLDPGESPSGNGNYLHGAVDTIQASYQSLLGGGGSTSSPEATTNLDSREKKRLMESMYQLSSMETTEMFPESTVQNVYDQLKRHRDRNLQ